MLVPILVSLGVSLKTKKTNLQYKKVTETLRQKNIRYITARPKILEYLELRYSIAHDTGEYCNITNSISVISGWWKGDYESHCETKCHLGLEQDPLIHSRER